MLKKSKTALLLSTVLLTGLVASPVLADNRDGDDDDDKNRGHKESKEMRFKMDDDFLKGKWDDDFYKNKSTNSAAMMAKFESIQKAIESKNYTDFTKALSDAEVKETITEAQFNIIAEAYTKAKSGDVKGAQELLKSNNLNPMLHGFIMGQHMQLTDAQKEVLKKAEELIKQGKIDEAKALIESAGLPKPPIMAIDKNIKKEELKTAIETAKQLKSDGKIDEAKKVLSDAGIPERATEKLEKEFNREEHKERKSLVSIFKNFFRIGKNR